MKSSACWSLRNRMLDICLFLMACVFLAGTAFAAANTPKLRYVPNEYIIHVKAGTSYDDVKAMTAKLNATAVKALPLSDTYWIRVGATGGSGASGGSSTSNGRRLASTPVKWTIDSIQPNYLKQLSAIPNDEYWPKLWGMRMMNAPAAWDVEKGSSDVIVAVIDSGVSAHVDLISRLLPGADFVNPANQNGHNDDVGHGTHVAGTIAAQGDNGIGVCGVCWDGVQILPIKAGDESGLSSKAIIDSLSYAVANNARVVNMSFGGYYNDPAEHAAIKAAYDAGLILVAAAGNDSWSTMAPAVYPEVIAVSSVGPTEALASYSNFGKIDLAAPGGDAFTSYDEEIWSTYPGNSYQPMEGTSMAAPHVTGAAALLISHGVPASQVKDRLKCTARPPINAAYDPNKYGAGIVDLKAALSNASIKITSPVKGSTISGNPRFRASLLGIDPTSITVYLDYPDNNQDGIPDNLADDTYIVIDSTNAGTYLNSTNTSLSFDWPLPGKQSLATGRHRVYIRGFYSVEGTEFSDYCSFTITNQIIKAGVHLFAFPYACPVTSSGASTTDATLPSDFLLDLATGAKLSFKTTGPSQATLMRWIPRTSISRSVPYFMYNDEKDVSIKTKAEKLAWDYPLDQYWYTGGGFSSAEPNKYKFPAGTGFWLIIPKDAVINADYVTMPTNDAFNIYLYKGWNMIGNPYAQEIAWAPLFTYRGQGPKSLQDATTAGWVKASLFGFDSTQQKYINVTSRDTLKPYTGYWLQALVGSEAVGDQLILTVMP